MLVSSAFVRNALTLTLTYEHTERTGFGPAHTIENPSLFFGTHSTQSPTYTLKNCSVHLCIDLIGVVLNGNHSVIKFHTYVNAENHSVEWYIICV